MSETVQVEAGKAMPQRAIQPDAIYTAEEAAKLVNYHVVTIREKLRDGVIQGRRRHGGTWRILGRELLKLA